MSRGGSWIVLAVLMGLSLCWGGTPSVSAQEVKLSRKERQLVRSIEEDLERASRFYTNGKFDDCATAYKAALEPLAQLNDESPETLLKEIQPLHAKLVKAQELLKEKGQDVPAPPHERSRSNPRRQVRWLSCQQPARPIRHGNVQGFNGQRPVGRERSGREPTDPSHR
jgi:hypothetical protein